MAKKNLHKLAERRSLAIHAEVRALLGEQPRLLARARKRVAGWLRDESVSRVYAEKWRDILDGPPEQLVWALTDEGEEATALRQVSPFAGIIPARTRWKIWRKQRLAAGV